MTVWHWFCEVNSGPVLEKNMLLITFSGPNFDISLCSATQRCSLIQASCKWNRIVFQAQSIDSFESIFVEKRVDEVGIFMEMLFLKNHNELENQVLCLFYVFVLWVSSLQWIIFISTGSGVMNLVYKGLSFFVLIY